MGELADAKFKAKHFVFNAGMRVCPPLWLTNTDIRLVVCTAWVMRHQSDLQNSRGGAINHIGSGINHYVEDIFCHRCPLTITLHKTLSLSLPPPIHPSFPSSLHQPPKRPAIGLERKRKERDVLSTTSLKCKLKFIEMPERQPSERLSSRESNRRQWRL